MVNSKQFIGKTSGSNLYIYSQDELDDFVAKNQNKAAIIKVHLYSPGTCHAFIGYYRNKLLPDIQQALAAQGTLKRISTIDQELRQGCPVTINEYYDEISRSYKAELKPLEDLEKWQLIVFIDLYLYNYCAENLQIIIDKTAVL